MVRRIGEAVAVRVAVRVASAGAEPVSGPAVDQGTAGPAPASFIWRDRVYVVREILGYWRERRAWWSAAAARAVHGDVLGDVLGPVSGSAGGLRVAIDYEREVWRVEARGPRTVGTGVYDISREASEVPGEASPAWHLLAVAD